MANPYLIQALYGPKPPAPAASDTGESNGNLVPAPALRPLSLAERLHGKSAVPKTDDEEHMHPDRQNRGHIDDVMSDPNDVSKPWTPTGSNIMPLGIKSYDLKRATALPSLPPLTKQPTATATSMAALEFPPERYLPPPGLYYDEYNLALTLDLKFIEDKCWTCWGLQSACTKRGTCTKTCKVCRTTDHPGKICSSLYCSHNWYISRKVKRSIIRDKVRQFRPSRSEFFILLQQGYVVDTGNLSLPVVPNMAHPAVKSYYHNKPTPIVIQQRMDGKSPELMANTGQEVLMRRDSLPAAPPKTRNQVNASLDPRLQGKFAYTTALGSSIPKAVGTAESSIQGAITHNTAAPDQTVRKKTEYRIQELQDEVSRLKMDNLLKDFEIRRLNSENKKLSGDGYETGSKRPCF